MIKGRHIKIYLADGSVTGIRNAEIMGWTSQAAAILLGYPCSDSDYWLDQNGVSLKQKEAMQFSK